MSESKTPILDKIRKLRLNHKQGDNLLITESCFTEMWTELQKVNSGESLAYSSLNDTPVSGMRVIFVSSGNDVEIL